MNINLFKTKLPPCTHKAKKFIKINVSGLKQRFMVLSLSIINTILMFFFFCFLYLEFYLISRKILFNIFSSCKVLKQCGFFTTKTLQIHLFNISFLIDHFNKISLSAWRARTMRKVRKRMQFMEIQLVQSNGNTALIKAVRL